MKHGLRQGLPDRQHGFSLLELLIATTIGLVVTLGAIAVFSNSTSARQTTQAQSLMNEDAQAALSLLSREIKMAGYKDPASTSSSLGLRGCSGLFQFDANSVNDDKLKCETGGTSQPHSLVVSYEADVWNTVKSKSKSLPTDCLGTGLENQTPARNRYYIDISPSSGTPNLFCQGNGGSGSVPPQPMVDNIEDLKFSFGTATMPAPAASAASDPKPLAGYLSATEVEKLASSQPKSDIASVWNQVRTVQICIVVRSEATNLVADNASSIYTKCDGTQDASQTDRRLRRAYTTTVALRNRLNWPAF
jgi:type IV pilus assembly protein PilW